MVCGGNEWKWSFLLKRPWMRWGEVSVNLRNEGEKIKFENKRTEPKRDAKRKQSKRGDSQEKKRREKSDENSHEHMKAWKIVSNNKPWKVKRKLWHAILFFFFFGMNGNVVVTPRAPRCMNDNQSTTPERITDPFRLRFRPSSTPSYKLKRDSQQR